MAFIENALGILGFGKEITPYSHRVTLYGKSGALIEGVKKIAIYTEERVEFLIKECMLVISGSNIKITKYCEGEVCLVGEITGVNYY